MGHKLSCGGRREDALFGAVPSGDLEVLEAMVEADPKLLSKTLGHSKFSSLHVAALNGQIEVLNFLLDRYGNPDVVSRYKQTPLMLAAMHGKLSCLRKLMERGAYVLMFESLHGRTCLHYAACYGHIDCLEDLLSFAQASSLAESWGFARFVNIRDERGATPLHLAALEGFADCVHALLDNGALVCASTSGNDYPGSTPLHYAARGGSLDCIRELLAWGADRLQPDAFGRIPYIISLKHKHEACAALLNPASAEPLVWPLPLRFISNLNAEAKALLEEALMKANRERERAILKDDIEPLHFASDFELEDGENTALSDSDMASDADVCCICFDQLCTIEIKECGHRMCAHCVLALCCHNKPNQLAHIAVAPVCPFCRSSISQLVLAKVSENDVVIRASSPKTSSAKTNSEADFKSSPSRSPLINCTESEVEMSPSKPSKSRKSSEGSGSLKSLSAISSLGKMGSRSLGKSPIEFNGGSHKASPCICPSVPEFGSGEAN